METKRLKSNRMLIYVLCVVLLVTLVFSTFACTKQSSTTTSPASQPIKLVFSTHESNTGLYYTRFWKPWIDEIEKRTNGKVKIEAHFNGELAGPPDAWDVLVK